MKVLPTPTTGRNLFKLTVSTESCISTITETTMASSTVKRTSAERLSNAIRAEKTTCATEVWHSKRSVAAAEAARTTSSYLIIGWKRMWPSRRWPRSSALAQMKKRSVRSARQSSTWKRRRSSYSTTTNKARLPTNLRLSTLKTCLSTTSLGTTPTAKRLKTPSPRF